jgi:predicted transcriptional regulator
MSRILEKRGRDRLYIIAEILEIAKNGALKTRIMYRANLSFTQLNDYLGFMLETHLLEKIRRNGKDIYRSTEKGLDFLERYHQIQELMREEIEAKEKIEVKYERDVRK